MICSILVIGFIIMISFIFNYWFHFCEDFIFMMVLFFYYLFCFYDRSLVVVFIFYELFYFMIGSIFNNWSNLIIGFISYD